MIKCEHDWREIRSVKKIEAANFVVYFYCSKCLEFEIKDLEDEFNPNK
jgi:hypothetical protein